MSITTGSTCVIWRHPILYFSMSVCMYVCLLPFFSTTAEPFALKFVMVFRNGVGKTAKHSGADWMHIFRVMA